LRQLSPCSSDTRLRTGSREVLRLQCNCMPHRVQGPAPSTGPFRRSRGSARAGIKTVVGEFDRDGIVHEEGGVRITAFEVDHGDAIKPTCDYPFDYGGRSAVISGDTRYSENLIRHVQGVDLLVHEVCCAQTLLLEDPVMRRVAAHHTSPRDAGRVFTHVHPRLAPTRTWYCWATAWCRHRLSTRS